MREPGEFVTAWNSFGFISMTLLHGILLDLFPWLQGLQNTQMYVYIFLGLSKVVFQSLIDFQDDVMLHVLYCEADCDFSLCRLQMIHCLILTSFWPPQCKCLTMLVLHGLGHPFCNHSRHFVLCWPTSLNLDSFYTFFSLRSCWYHKLVINRLCERAPWLLTRLALAKQHERNSSV